MVTYSKDDMLLWWEKVVFTNLAVLKPRCQLNKITKKMHAVPRELGYPYHQFPRWLKFQGNLDFLKGKSWLKPCIKGGKNHMEDAWKLDLSKTFTRSILLGIWGFYCITHCFHKTSLVKSIIYLIKSWQNVESLTTQIILHLRTMSRKFKIFYWYITEILLSLFFIN